MADISLQSTNYLKQVVQMFEDCIEEISLDGMILSVNPYGLALLQAQSDAQMVGKLWSSMWPLESHAALARAMEDARHGRVSRFTAECPTLKGESRWWRVTVGPLFDEANEVTSLLAISRDVTAGVKADAAAQLMVSALRLEVNAANDRMQRAQDQTVTLAEELHQSFNDQETLTENNDRLQLELDVAVAARALADLTAQQAQKGEAIGQLVSGIAHDFNNMMHTCVTSLGLLIAQADKLDVKQRKWAGYALSAAQHAGQLAKRLLSFGRVHPYNAKPFELNNSIKNMLPLIEHSLGKGMAIHLVDSEPALRLHADEHAVEQSLMNLCINARDACGGEGVIDVSLGRVDIDEAEASIARPAGSYVFVEVRDNGAGMTPDVKERIFEPFFTTKPDGVGTGLGLAQIYSAVRQAYGFIDVWSEVGSGTRIRLLFPAIDEPLSV